jgi:hypothetical protein
MSNFFLEGNLIDIASQSLSFLSDFHDKLFDKGRPRASVVGITTILIVSLLVKVEVANLAAAAFDLIGGCCCAAYRFSWSFGI